MSRSMRTAVPPTSRRSCPKPQTKSGAMIARQNGGPTGGWNAATTRGKVRKVGLVLSGGGAKAIAHAGAFHALEQADLAPSHIVATSMGSVIGAAIASGLPFEQVRQRAMGLRRKDIAPFDPKLLVLGLFARSLFPATALRRAIAKIVPKARFEYLRIPLTVTAVDLDSGELLLLGGRERRTSDLDRRGRDIELGDALYASCALPLYFPPLEADGRRLADGGVRAVLPPEGARALVPGVG